MPRRRAISRSRKVGAPSRRRDILDLAAHLMKEKGFAGTSAQHVADAMEFSKANFFYHVESKEQLLYEIFIETLNFAIGATEDILKRDDPPSQKLRATVDFYVHLMTERTAVMLVWFREREHLTPEHQREVLRLERRIRDLLRDFYTSAIAAGEFRQVDPAVTELAIFGMCFMLTRWPPLQDNRSIHTLSVQLQQLICGGLLRG